MRLLKLFRLAAAVVFGAVAASAQVTVRLSVPTVPVALPALAVPVLPAMGAALSPAFAAPLSLTPTMAAIVAAPAAAQSQLILPGAFHSAPVAENPVEANDYGKLFDGAATTADGVSIRPRLIDAKADATIRLPLQLGIVRAEVERALPALRESVALGSWNGPHTTLSESCCGDAAPKLAAILRARGLPARLVEAEFHYYVMLDLPEAQIIIDPTIRQFFGKKGAPRGIPDVFVGTIEELGALLHNYRMAKTTRYETGRIYFSEAVSREGKLGSLEIEIHRGGPRDLEPLRRILGLAPSTPPAPVPPRLIIP